MQVTLYTIWSKTRSEPSGAGLSGAALTSGVAVSSVVIPTSGSGEDSGWTGSGSLAVGATSVVDSGVVLAAEFDSARLLGDSVAGAWGSGTEGFSESAAGIRLAWTSTTACDDSAKVSGGAMPDSGDVVAG